MNRAIAGVIDSGRFILGPEVEAFERELAAFLGVRHVVGVANGTDAITIALRGLGVGPGDEVIVPSFTFYASAEAIPHTGARPVFCDVDPDTFCVTAETVERALTPATKAVIAVHLFGRAAPVGDLRQLSTGRGVAILEDARRRPVLAVAGRRAGSLGDAATFSFFPSKNLFCFGDGGAIATNDDEVAAARAHPAVPRLPGQEHVHRGGVELPSRCPAGGGVARDPGAARRLERPPQGAGRGLRARRGSRAGRRCRDPPRTRNPSTTCTRSAPSIQMRRRGRWPTPASRPAPYYRVPVHMQPAMAAGPPPHDLPGTMRAAETNLALPMGPTLPPTPPARWSRRCAGRA